MRLQPDAAKRCELEILLERVTILKSLKSRLSSKSGRGGCLIISTTTFDKAFCLSPKGDPDLFVINKQPWFRQVKRNKVTGELYRRVKGYLEVLLAAAVLPSIRYSRFVTYSIA